MESFERKCAKLTCWSRKRSFHCIYLPITYTVIGQTYLSNYTAEFNDSENKNSKLHSVYIYILILLRCKLLHEYFWRGYIAVEYNEIMLMLIERYKKKSVQYIHSSLWVSGNLKNYSVVRWVFRCTVEPRYGRQRYL